MFEAIMQKKSNHFIKGPHPKATILPTSEAIGPFLRDRWIWQNKINGRRLQVVLTTTGETELYNRQGLHFYFKVPIEVIEALYRFYAPKEKWTILEGEWLNGKLYLFDILVLDGKRLTNLAYPARHVLLKRDYILPNLCVLPIHKSLNKALEILKSDEPEIEGIVLKSPHPGMTDDHIVRCRKK